MSKNPATSSVQKHPVYMVSGNDSYLEELSTVISPYYQPRMFTDHTLLIDALFEELPKSLIIDGNLEGTSAMRFISTVRLSFNSKQLPLIFTVMQAQESWINEARRIEGLECLQKPYPPATLIETISDQISTAVEAQWDMIEPVQQAALKRSIGFYNSIADAIMSGEIIDYADAIDCCEPLVEAVKKKNYQDILKTMREHDNLTYVHCMRTATFLCAFGQYIGITGHDLETLTIGGFLLDVGKNYIPKELLNKAEPLDDQEFATIKEHVDYGINFLNKIDDLPKGVAIIAEQHHEKIDGSGYPHGLKGAQFHSLARMAAIVDVFCALTDRRVYKKPMTSIMAMATMAQMEGHLDRQLLVHFGEMLMSGPALH